jgi:hypothetical protein
MARRVSRILNTSVLYGLFALTISLPSSGLAQGSSGAKSADVSSGTMSAQLATWCRELKPGSTDAQAQEWSRGFLEHLRRTSPIIHERLLKQTIDLDEIRSRFSVYLETRVAAPKAAAVGQVKDPATRVIEALAKEGDLGTEPGVLKELADKFLVRLSQRSRMASVALEKGEMNDEELVTRIKSFASEIKTELEASKIDPKTAGLPALIDQFLQINIGQAPERAHAIAFSGTIEQKGKKRQFVIFKSRPNRMRMHIVEEGVVVGLLGFDGAQGWSQSPGQPAVRVVGSAEEDLTLMARFDPPLVDASSRSAQVDRLEDGADGSIRIRVRERDGSESISTLHPTTLYEQTIETRRAGGRKEETRCSDHRKIGVLNVAHVQEQWIDDVLQSTTRIEKVNLDSGMIASFFERPRGRSIDFLGYMGLLRTVIAQERGRSEKAETPAK